MEDVEPEGAYSVEGELLKQFTDWDRALDNHWAKWRIEARMCYDIVSGDQWDPEAKAKLEEELRVPVVFNRTGPMVDAVIGAQINNRQEVKYFPREQGDVGVNELYTAAADWARDECDAEDEESDAFLDCLVCGMGWTNTLMEYEEDPAGMVEIPRIDPLEMAADPTAKRRNITDAQYIRRAKTYTKDQFDEAYPEHRGVWASGSATGDQESRAFVRTNAEDDYAGNNNDHTDRAGKADEVVVHEYQWFEKETTYRLIDPTTGQLVDLDADEYERLKEGFESADMELDAVKVPRRVYFRAFATGNTVLEWGDLPDQEFTYKCITGKRDRNKSVWYGVVRAMVDPQRWFNKWMTQILVIMDKNSKGGIMYEVGAFEDPAQAEEDWARPDAMVPLEEGGLNKIKEKGEIKYPAALDRMLVWAAESFKDVSGINTEMLGLVDRNQPGVLEHQRKEAGYAILSVFFDSMRRYRKLQGRLLLKYIQNYMTDGRLIRIVGERSGLQRYIPLVRTSPDHVTFDVIVDEAAAGPNQKEKVWGMVMQLMPTLQSMGLPPAMWAEMVQYAPLPESLSSKLVELINQPPDPQAMQRQQQAFQLEVGERQAEIEKDVSQAELNRARAASERADAAMEPRRMQIDAFKAQADALTRARQATRQPVRR